jgi:hypothetical protein
MSHCNSDRGKGSRFPGVTLIFVALAAGLSGCGGEFATGTVSAALTGEGLPEIGQCSLAPEEPLDPRAPDAYTVTLSTLEAGAVDPAQSAVAVTLAPADAPVHPRLVELLSAIHDVPAEIVRQNSLGSSDGLFVIAEAAYVSGRNIGIDLLLSNSEGTAVSTCSMSDAPYAEVNVTGGDGETGCDVSVAAGESLAFAGHRWPSPDDLPGQSDSVPLPNSNVLFALIDVDFDAPPSESFFDDCAAAGRCFLGGLPVLDESGLHPGPISVSGASGQGLWSVAWTPAEYPNLASGRYLAYFFTASTMNAALDAAGHRLFYPCAIDIEQPATACGSLHVEAYRHHVGKKAYKEPLNGAAVAIIDKSPWACWRAACGDSISPHVYACIIAEVFETGNCPGDVAAAGIIGEDGESGVKVFELPAGDYVVLAQGLKTSTGLPMGVSASDFQCAPDNNPSVVTMRKHLEETVR